MQLGGTDRGNDDAEASWPVPWDLPLSKACLAVCNCCEQAVGTAWSIGAALLRKEAAERGVLAAAVVLCVYCMHVSHVRSWIWLLRTGTCAGLTERWISAWVGLLCSAAAFAHAVLHQLLFRLSCVCDLHSMRSCGAELVCEPAAEHLPTKRHTAALHCKAGVGLQGCCLAGSIAQIEQHVQLASDLLIDWLHVWLPRPAQRLPEGREALCSSSIGF